MHEEGAKTTEDHSDRSSIAKQQQHAVPAHLRNYPSYHDRAALCAVGRFGKVQYRNGTNIMEIRLRRIPTSWKLDFQVRFMIQREKGGVTARARYQEINAEEVARCQFAPCNYSNVTSRNLGRSIGIQSRESHNAPALSLVITFSTPGENR